MASKLALQSGTKIVCIGANYAAHVAEMAAMLGSAMAPAKDPTIFLKPLSSYVHPLASAAPTPLPLPTGIGEVHHELELGVVVGSTMRRVAAADALSHVGGFVIALDLTARDLQSAAKTAGKPWTVAKGYDGFCPVSDVVPWAPGGGVDLMDLDLYLDVNGERRQECNTSGMTTSIPDMLAYVSSVMVRCCCRRRRRPHRHPRRPPPTPLHRLTPSPQTLERGDLVLTGTPSGVGPLVAGDKVVGGVAGHVEGRWECVDAR